MPILHALQFSSKTSSLYQGDHARSEIKKEATVPFRDFPAYRLESATAAEAAEFAVEYASIHALRSPLCEFLAGFNGPGLSLSADSWHKLWDNRRRFSGGSDFREETDTLIVDGVGNSLEMCKVAARALAEFGYPYKVQIIEFQGTVTLDNKHFNATNTILRIGARDPNERWIADPFLQSYTQTPALGKQFKSTFNRTPKATYKNTEASKEAYVLLQRSGAKILSAAASDLIIAPYQDVVGLNTVMPCLKSVVSRDMNGGVTSKLASDLWVTSSD